MRFRLHLLMLCWSTLLLHACVEDSLVKFEDASTADAGGKGGDSGKGGSGGKNNMSSGGKGGSGMSGSGGKGGSGGMSNMSSGGNGGGSGMSGSGGGNPMQDASMNDSGGGMPGDRTYSTNRDDFFGAPRCATAGTLLCEDFESGNLDGSRWSTKLAPAMIDGMQHARGTKALHVSTSGTNGSGIETNDIFPVTGGKYFGRMFVYFTGLPTDPDGAHWTIVGSNQAAGIDNGSEIRVGGQFNGDINVWGVGTDGGPTGDWTNHDNDPGGSPKTPPLNEWLCIEWMHDSEQDKTQFWWDGVEHQSLATTADDHGGTFDGPYDIPTIGSVWVGFWNYFGTPDTMEFDTWIDEVALDGQRIGCDI